MKKEAEIKEEFVYESVILVRIGEIALKGLNRSQFISRLIKNIKDKISSFGDFKVTQKQSRIWIVPENNNAINKKTLSAAEEDSISNSFGNKINPEAVMEEVLDVFGLVSASIAWKIKKDWDYILEGGLRYTKNLMEKNPEYKTFKVEGRRSDKNFPLSSPEICEMLGGWLLEKIDGLEVDVHNPDFTLTVEIRDEAYIYSGKKSGFRGLPVGTAGRGMLLLSGGIDSPVAGFMMASRGMALEAIYFHTFPYTGDEVKEKVIELTRILKKYAGRIKLHIVDFTHIQLELQKNTPSDMLTVIMRRLMMKIASRLATDRGIPALITGESLGQVASQTPAALLCTDEASNLPVYRPLIGLDKEEIIKISRRIGAFETSTLPYDDCCTVFVARHPKLAPELDYCKKIESNIDVDSLVNYGLENIEVVVV